MSHARSFFGARDLLREWTRRTIRARYQQSLLGWLWAVIQPVTQAVVLAVVFTRVVRIDTGDTPYVVFAYVATVSWAFLIASLTDMTSALVDNMGLVGKIYFPREVLPLGHMLARLADLGMALLLFFGLAVVFRMPVFSPWLVFLPVVVLVQILLVAGLGLACAAGNVFVRDVRSFLLLATQVWFYASPVIYPVAAVPAWAQRYYVLNPMVGIIEGYRAVLVYGRAPDASLLVAALVSTVVFVCGHAFFKKVEFRFADMV